MNLNLIVAKLLLIIGLISLCVQLYILCMLRPPSHATALLCRLVQMSKYA